MLVLSTISSLKSYFSDIAIGTHHHKDITGFVFGGNDVIQSNGKSLESCVLWCEWYNPDKPFRVSSGMTENFLKKKSVRLAVLVPTTRKSFGDKETAYDFCEAIITQIYSKMYLDKVNYTISFNIDSITMGPTTVDISSTEYTGCALEFEFNDNQGFTYDPAKWN